MAAVEINVDEYRNLLCDSIRLCNTQKYVLGEIQNKTGHYVSINKSELIIYLGITEEAKEADDEAEDRLAKEKEAENE